MIDGKLYGFRRADGSKGIRNKILVAFTVQCARFVAEEISRLSCDPDLDVVGFDGCVDNPYALKTLTALAKNPNVGAVIAVGHGCEYIHPRLIAESAAGNPSEWFYIQDKGGTQGSIAFGLKLAKKLRRELDAQNRVPMGIDELSIGLECGGSDATSGLAANPVLGEVADCVTDAGGRVVFEEVLEAVGLRDYLLGRACDSRCRDELAELYDRAVAYCKKSRQYSVSPGNFTGGLTTIEEKSIGAVIKSGTRAINGVIRVGDRPRSGLWIFDNIPDEHFLDFGYANPSDSEGLTMLAASGCHLSLMTTGRGSVVGSAVSPVIKVTGNAETYEKMRGDMDMCAFSVLAGEETKSSAAKRLLNIVMDVANGKRSKSEAMGHKEYYILCKHQSCRMEVNEK